MTQQNYRQMRMKIESRNLNTTPAHENILKFSQKLSFFQWQASKTSRHVVSVVDVVFTFRTDSDKAFFRRLQNNFLKINLRNFQLFVLRARCVVIKSSHIFAQISTQFLLKKSPKFCGTFSGKIVSKIFQIQSNLVTVIKRAIAIVIIR